MVILNELLTLMKCFPGSCITSDGFLSLNKKHSGFSVKNLESVDDIKYKLLAWVSRDACKTQFYQQRIRDIRLWAEVRDSMNEYLGTHFSQEDMMKIYTRIGNDVNRKLGKEFIQSGYDMTMLEEKDERKGIES